MSTRKKRRTSAGAYVRANRKHQRLTMRALASKLGVHWTLVSQWEHGQTFISKALINPLCAAIGLHAPQLIAFIDDDLKYSAAAKHQRLQDSGPIDVAAAEFSNGGANERGTVDGEATES